MTEADIQALAMRIVLSLEEFPECVSPGPHTADRKAIFEHYRALVHRGVETPFRTAQVEVVAQRLREMAAKLRCLEGTMIHGEGI